MRIIKRFKNVLFLFNFDIAYLNRKGVALGGVGGFVTAGLAKILKKPAFGNLKNDLKKVASEKSVKRLAKYLKKSIVENNSKLQNYISTFDKVLSDPNLDPKKIKLATQLKSNIQKSININNANLRLIKQG